MKLRCNSLILIRKDKGNYGKKQRFRRKKVKVIKKVDLIKTIRQIPHGETVQFARQELDQKRSVRSAVWRLNDRLKKLTGRQEPEYSLELVDMGLFYNITRV